MSNNLTKWDPFAELQSLQNQFFGDDWLTPFKTVKLATTDVYMDKDKELVVEAHMPNFSEKDVDISLDGNALVISAEKHEKEEDKNKKYVIRESSSSFYRRIQLPKHADQDSIKADMKDGILTVRVPFKELPKPKKISISAKGKK
jgi:HSP20 family protein